MLYKSTRSNETVSSREALLSAMASDGGLYVPEEIPKFDFKDMINLSYGDMAIKILSPFFDDLGDLSFIKKVYGEKFPKEIIPIKKCSNLYFAELYHGKSHAFKDFALSLLPEFLTLACSDKKTIRVLVATSGDTGAAAIKAFENVKGTEAIVFYPKGHVSEVQELQMLSSDAKNILTVTVNGNFDECQSALKQVYADREFLERMLKKDIMISSANSINIGRFLPQIVYYVYSYLKLCREKEIEYGELLNVAVPTGNFGNILAAYYAKLMGLPFENFICASNENDVLANFFKTKVYTKKNELKTTISPAMDILVSSNLERLLYLKSGRDFEKISDVMEILKKEDSFAFDESFEDFKSEMATEKETLREIKNTYEDFGYLIDPHTAVAKAVLGKLGEKEKTLIMSTAHPFKFPKTCLDSIADEYGAKISSSLLSLLTGVSIPKELGLSINRSEIKTFENKLLDIPKIAERILK